LYDHRVPGESQGRGVRGTDLGAALIGLAILLCGPGDAAGQVFLASRPKPEFTLGPLFIRANVRPAAGPVDVTVLFSLVVPAGVDPGTLAQDLYLLWPGEVDGEAVPALPTPSPAGPSRRADSR
jgi:hypothetical protein